MKGGRRPGRLTKDAHGAIPVQRSERVPHGILATYARKPAHEIPRDFGLGRRSIYDSGVTASAGAVLGPFQSSRITMTANNAPNSALSSIVDTDSSIGSPWSMI